MGTKDLFHYFKRDSQTSLPCKEYIYLSPHIDAINRDVSRISSSLSDEAPKTEVNISK